MKKRIIAFVLVLTAIAVMLCSCAKPSNEKDDVSYSDTGKAKIIKITLPYSNSDSLNPYFAKGNENLALAYIYCQPLFTVKSDYTSEAVIADSCVINDKNVEVSLNPIMFSDGSAVTSRDIVYSFELAKKSEAFSQRLLNVEKAVVSGSSVTFLLKNADKLVKNVLTFPIVKSGTADSVDSVPIGSGVFMFNGKQQLTVNPYGQAITSINTVELRDIKTLELAVSELEIGNINYLFEDFSEGKFKGIVSQSKNVTLNNLVFLGINANDERLSSSAVRTAIYYAVDKVEASQTPYQGYAVASAVPFNPDFFELEKANMPDARGDKTKALSIIEKLGYSHTAKNGTASSGENRLKFSLIVNKNNSFRVAAANKIAENLEKCGFKIEVVKLSSEAYKQRINDGEYQLCLGEVKLPENMDLSVFANGFYEKSISEDLTFFKDYKSYKAGKSDINELVESFLNDVPFVPICYRVGVAAYTKTYSPDFTYAPFDIYGNIENWEAEE